MLSRWHGHVWQRGWERHSERSIYSLDSSKHTLVADSVLHHILLKKTAFFQLSSGSVPSDCKPLEL